MDKIRLKIGDTVKVITGTDKGSIGEITSILRKDKKVVVSDVNKKFKHVKPRTKEDTGEIKQFEAPIHISNVMLCDNGVASRFGMANKDGKKIRCLKKTNVLVP
jgi:large subunit ribosomal protein L24